MNSLWLIFLLIGIIISFFRVYNVSKNINKKTNIINNPYKNKRENSFNSNLFKSEDYYNRKLKVVYIPNSLNFKIYKVSGIYINTGRKRTLTLNLHKNDDLAIIMQENGFSPPYKIQEIMPNPPSEKQLEYVTDVYENLPPNLTSIDVSALLTRYENGDLTPPNSGLVEFADNRKIQFSYYIGKKGLYNLIFENLKDLDKIAFFCFSLYRYLSDDRHSNLDTSPLKSYFYDFAQNYIDDEQFLKSLLRYKGENLRFFGKLHITTKVGQKVVTGGSTNTIAYKKASEYLHNKFGLPLKLNKTLID